MSPTEMILRSPVWETEKDNWWGRGRGPAHRHEWSSGPQTFARVQRVVWAVSNQEKISDLESGR